MSDKDFENDDMEFEDVLLDDELDSEEEEDIDAVLDEAFESEEFEDEWDDGTDLDEFGEPAKGKADKTRTIIYLVAGVAVVGIVGYHVLNRTVEMSAPIMAPTEAREVAEGSVVETISPDGAQRGFLLDPTELGEGGALDDRRRTPPMPSAVMDFKTPEEAQLDSPVEQSADVLTPMPEPDDSPEIETEIVTLDFDESSDDLPGETQSVVDVVSLEDISPVVEDVAPISLSSPKNAKPAVAQPMAPRDDSKYQALTSEIQSLEHAIKELKADGQKEKEQDLKEIASLNNTIVKLENKIERLLKEQKIAETKQKAMKSVEKKPQEVKKKVIKAPETSVSQPPVSRLSAHKSTISTVKTPQIRKKIISWELRSAQPGRAIVSQKGHQDIKTVEIGDFLSGVGQIRNISFVNGKWVVEGSVSNITR